jgi:hypothetical protein
VKVNKPARRALDAVILMDLKSGLAAAGTEFEIGELDHGV